MGFEQLTDGSFYHIYNRGNNRRNLFSVPSDFEHFLRLYKKYITPVAETFAWVLMPNHFHLLVQIRKNIVYKYYMDSKQSKDELWFREHKWETMEDPGSSVGTQVKKPVPYRHFAHLFNAYTRHYNKKTGGTGNLFERPFKRIEVDNHRYLEMLIVYIHNNPVHHGFCSHPLEYPWSGLSNLSDLSDLSACATPDNVSEKVDKEKDDNVREKVNYGKFNDLKKRFDNFSGYYNNIGKDFENIEKGIDNGYFDVINKISDNK